MLLTRKVAVSLLMSAGLLIACGKLETPTPVLAPKVAVVPSVPDQGLRAIIKTAAEDSEDRYREQRAVRRGERNFEGAEENWRKDEHQVPNGPETR